MKVRDLIEYLEAEDQDKEVYFSYPAGDYWHTTVAVPAENVDELALRYSDYHQKFEVLEDDGDSEDPKLAVVIS